MAEYIVSFVLEKIACQLMDEAISLSRVSDQVEWIEREFRRMQCFLKWADAKKDDDERVKTLITDIRDVAYETEDVIDKYVLEIKQTRERKRYSFVVLFELFYLCKLNKEISRIKTKIHDISTSRSTYGIENIGRQGEGTSSRIKSLKEKRQYYPRDCKEDVVGIDEHIRILEEQLICGELKRSVVSIIGMAGIGKTTLAKKIYQSAVVRNHFNCHAWVYVSQDYRVRDILQYLCNKIMGFGKVDLENMYKEEIEEELSKFLARKKYLVVLDDIWRTDVWDELEVIFSNGTNGSRIIFTTRFKDIALHARSSPYELSFLNEEDSWELLAKKAFVEGDNVTTKLPPWSEELGKQIAHKCGGLPLAIVVLGGLLSRKEATYNEWLKILQSVQWQLTQDSKKCIDILNLSYQDLPYYLKSCFLYVGLFPEDFEISARKLILLWIAEGFVQLRGNEPSKDVAEDYLEELIGRSMIQVASRKSNGRIKMIRVHDLLRELSILKAKEDRFLDIIHGDVNAHFLTQARRLAIHFGIPSISRNVSIIRSLLFFNASVPVWLKLKVFKLLHVLDLEGVHIALLDTSIGNLLHLRYLGLNNTWLKKLPPSTSNLINLQTLDLRATLIDPIPIAIWKMQQLKHLYLNEAKRMTVNPPKKSSSLVNLLTLQGLCLGKSSCIEQVLNKLPNLRDLALHGELILHEEALIKWISNLKDLRCLKLCSRGCDGIIMNSANVTMDSIPRFTAFSSHINLYKLHLNGFHRRIFDVQYFPPNLSELSLQYSFLMEDPMEKLEKLPGLRVLKLKQSSYVGKEMVCSNGGFPQLQYLKLSNLYSVERWTIEEGAMRSLRHLEIVECKRLKIGPTGLWPVTSLRGLRLGYLPYDFEMMARDRRGENWYKLEHVLPA